MQTYHDEHAAGILIGIDGVIGLEYTLDDIPLNFAFGVGPSIQLTHGPDPSLLERRSFSKVHLLVHI